MKFPVKFTINKTKVIIFGLTEDKEVIVKIGKDKKTTMSLEEYNDVITSLAGVGTKDMNPGIKWYSWCSICDWESDCEDFPPPPACEKCGEFVGMCPCPKP